MSIDTASALTGGLARVIGPRLPISDRARANIRNCFPDWPESQIEATLVEMWDNFGRIAGEFAHLHHLDYDGNDARIEVSGRDHVAALVSSGGPGIFFSAHVGNWELMTQLNRPLELRLHMVYRSMNAPLAEWVLRRTGGPESGVMIRKKPAGAYQLARAMRNNGHIAIMVDQKLNEGITVPFFGRPAPTSPAVAIFALRYRCPVLPVRVIRRGGPHFSVVIEPPLDLPDSGDPKTDTMTLMTTINQRVEDWIREYPGQWLWLHRRWGK